MQPDAPADLKNPSEYSHTDESGEAVQGNFWDEEYQPTENIDDIPVEE